LLGKEKSRLSNFDRRAAASGNCPLDRAKPSLLIADEPTGNLDPQLALEIMKIVQTLNEVGVTVVIGHP